MAKKRPLPVVNDAPEPSGIGRRQVLFRIRHQIIQRGRNLSYRVQAVAADHRVGVAQATPGDPFGASDYFMDMFEGQGGNDADRIEHGCHAVLHKGGRTGGSNFAFVDGSVRYLKYGRSTWPLNLWAVSDADRLSYAFIAP